MLIFVSGVTFAINSIKVFYQGNEVQWDIPPKIENGKIVVPLRTMADTLGFDVKWNSEERSVTITDKEPALKVIARLSEANATLSAIEDKKWGMYEQFKLQVGNMTGSFPDWKNSTNPTYGPRMFFKDINGDGKKELVIILISGHGTGVLDTHAYVFHEVYQEGIGYFYDGPVLIDNPMAIVLKNVKTNLTPKEAEINIGEKKYTTNIEDLNISPGNLFPDVGLGNSIKYDIYNNELIVSVGTIISPASSLGSIIITYEYKDNMYQAKRIEYGAEPEGLFSADPE